MAEQKKESDVPETEDNDEKTNKGKKLKKIEKSHNESKGSKSDEDKELSELLDSALGDFTLNESEDDENEPGEVEAKPKPTPPNTLWDEEFLKQASERLNQSFQSGFSAGDTPLTAEQLGQNIQSLAEAVTQMAGGAEASPDVEFSNFFAQTLKQFSETPEASQRPFSEEDFRSMMTNLNSCMESPEFSEIFPLIFSMMQNLLSKEVLYADLKGIIEKYPQWLEDNKAKLPSYEYDRHLKKFEILREVCSELEKESSNDTEEVKRARCDRILLLMLQIQDLGPMPSEIAGDLAPMLGLDSHGNPQLPPNMSPNQCTVI